MIKRGESETGQAKVDPPPFADLQPGDLFEAQRWPIVDPGQNGVARQVPAPKD